MTWEIHDTFLVSWTRHWTFSPLSEHTLPKTRSLNGMFEALINLLKIDDFLNRKVRAYDT
jgi:hypothetical protein